MNQPVNKPSYWYATREKIRCKKGILCIKPLISINISDELAYTESVENYRLPDRSIRATFTCARGSDTLSIIGEVNGKPAAKEVLILIAREALGFDVADWEDLTDFPERRLPAHPGRKPPSFAMPPFIAIAR